MSVAGLLEVNLRNSRLSAKKTLVESMQKTETEACLFTNNTGRLNVVKETQGLKTGRLKVKSLRLEVLRPQNDTNCSLVVSLTTLHRKS
jgi:hypothetical protein